MFVKLEEEEKKTFCCVRFVRSALGNKTILIIDIKLFIFSSVRT